MGGEEARERSTQTDGPEGEQCGEGKMEIGRENEGERIEIELMTPTSRDKNKGTKCSAT